jgi:predicted regulator of Ras-like GTPase activity (Roadblock/LC7/MglB family)
MADSPFRESITQLVEKLDGGVAAVLMGFNGISIDSYAKGGYDGALPDIQTLSMEFAHIIGQARRTLQSLDAGALEEFTLRAEAMTLVVRILTEEYFLACAVLPTGSLGKARYLMRVTAPALRADL